jgi:hypothetical protein
MDTTVDVVSGVHPETGGALFSLTSTRWSAAATLENCSCTLADLTETLHPVADPAWYTVSYLPEQNRNAEVERASVFMFAHRPPWQWHNLVFGISLFVFSGAVSLTFASLRAKKRGPAPRVLGGSFLDDYFAFIGDLFVSWLVLGGAGALILERINREKLWAWLFK